ncbi:MAG: hypothetical protein IJZ77_00315 [Bacilli bacterium]|nr:hypothetical protein [Bacilli bacterium]
MLAGTKKWLFAVCTSILTVACVTIGYNHVTQTQALESTNRNELYSPSEYNVSVSSEKNFVKIYENKNFEYYYSSSKTILRIVNKKSGFVWSTGANLDNKDTMQSNCSGIGKYTDEYYGCAIDAGPLKDGKANEKYYADLNGLLTFTYVNSNVGSASKNTETKYSIGENTTTSLFGHQSYANEWMFKLTYTEMAGERINYDFSFNLRFTFTEDGFDIHMYNEDIGGETKELIEAVYPLPKLGQSGGKLIQCKIGEVDENGKGDCDFSDTSSIIDNARTNLDGYIFVPDGSGALIRFDNVKYYNSGVEFYYDMYKDPYRNSPNEIEFQASNEVFEPYYVPTKHISMPVWGVAYGNNQDAFVAYVTEGSEYFGLTYKGRTSAREYASIEPRFERNRKYSYRFGTGLASTMVLLEDEIYQYDIGVSYNFLQGDGSDGELPANYVGMALKYRDYLQTNNLIKNDVELVSGPKVDFLICDVKEGIFGYSDVNVTSTNEIVDMLSELNEDGIKNITSTLYGWQDGGVSKAKPWTTNFNKKAGGKAGFKKVVETAAEYGYDIDFYQQYGMINEAQVASFNAYCVKALSRDYGIYVLSDINKPITWWEYTNADVAGKWLNKQANVIMDLGDNVGITTGGIPTLLVPDYGKSLDYKLAANSIYHSTKEAASKLSLSGDTPNSYLWKNYDKFTNISVYNSQLQCETDSVPFMEIVFGGLVNMYAEYANFSFYDKVSQLKMIDYNLNPSFIISASENTDIMYTNSRDWFATAYTSFKPIINEINDFVVPTLELIQGKTMVNREVVEFDNGAIGLYINTYATYDKGVVGDEKVVLAINYFDYDVTYVKDGKTYTIPALSAMELK